MRVKRSLKYSDEHVPLRVFDARARENVCTRKKRVYARVKTAS